MKESERKNHPHTRHTHLGPGKSGLEAVLVERVWQVSHEKRFGFSLQIQSWLTIVTSAASAAVATAKAPIFVVTATRGRRKIDNENSRKTAWSQKREIGKTDKQRTDK